jgi:hypothetical protein
MKAFNILKAAYNEELAQHLINTYKEVENNYYLKIWKTCELDAGHFIETTRRIIELELFTTYTSFDKSMSKFNEGELQRYERSSGNDSFRIIIPRVLYSAYTIRNKRGIAHISKLPPNEIDASLIIQSVKWTLAEIIRINSNLSLSETQLLVEEIIDRKVFPVWKDGERKRIIDNNLKTKEKILIMLFDESNLTDTKLCDFVEYNHITKFREILISMHKDHLIDYYNKTCKLLPKGKVAAENMLKTYLN